LSLKSPIAPPDPGHLEADPPLGGHLDQTRAPAGPMCVNASLQNVGVPDVMLSGMPVADGSLKV